MCGIAAVYSSDELYQHVEAMQEKILHRGRDSRSVIRHGNTTVGFNRLAITNISSEQPGRYGNTIVYLNGEIYNYKEFGTGTEMTVLAKSFDQYGINFVKKLNGMFAMIVIISGRTYIVRDRYGVKPMYYWQNYNSIYFCSEIKGFTALPDFNPVLNQSAVDQFMAMNNVLTNETMFKGVYQVQPATIWCIENSERYQYWQWDFTPEPMPYESAVVKVRDLVTVAIKRQTPSEVEFGTCLSGGIDSGIIRNVIGDKRSFTVGYAGEKDERELSEQQQSLGMHIVYSSVTNFNETIESLEDIRVGASWPNYGLYELASKFVKVLFDGAGADELFGGYPWRYDAQDYKSVVFRTGVDNNRSNYVYKNTGIDYSKTEGRLKFDAEYFLAGVLAVVDKLSSAHTIEVRVPFLDNDLVDFMTTVPTEFKQNKQLLKDAFSDVLPVDVVQGKKKGFTSPNWIKSDGNNQAHKWANAAVTQLKKTYFHEA